jgi:hypothetical protein
MYEETDFSFTPGFSPVLAGKVLAEKPFQRFSRVSPGKPLKRFLKQCESFATGLKPGVNEKDF